MISSLPRHAANSVLLLAFGSVLLLAGCGGVARQPVSGTVHYDGKPVVYGTISFEPDTTKGGDGPQGNAEIRLGKFQTEPDKGPKTGPHIVRIMAWSAGPEAGMLGAPIIANYTTSVEVDSTGKQLDFDVPPQKPN